MNLFSHQFNSSKLFMTNGDRYVFDERNLFDKTTKQYACNIKIVPNIGIQY